MGVLRRWKTWCPKCDCLQFAKPVLRTREGGPICVCGEPMIEVVVVSAAHSEGAVEALQRVDQMLADEDTYGPDGRPSVADAREVIRSVLSTIGGQSGAVAEPGFVSGPCAICCGEARLSDGRWCESCGKSGTVHMIVPAADTEGAVGRVAELEAEVARLRGEYVAGHRDGYREGSTSPLANPGGQ